jgi:hypothetical protein
MSRLLNNLKSVRNLRPSLSLADRYRGGRIERAVDYLKLVFNDYKQVLTDARNDARDRPLRASIIGSIIGLLGYCVARNPDEWDFRQQLIESQNNLSTVPKSTINRSSCDHVLELSQLLNEKLVSYQSLGLFSVLYLRDFSPNCCLFYNQCQYLRPKLYTYLWQRILDIGFVGKFRVLDNKMIDYDINYNEWTQ